MIARIDVEKCRGHGQCVLIAPEVFDLGDNDRAQVLVDVIPPELAAAVEDAGVMCPEGAIKLTGDATAG